MANGDIANRDRDRLTEGLAGDRYLGDNYSQTRTAVVLLLSSETLDKSNAWRDYGPIILSVEPDTS